MPNKLNLSRKSSGSNININNNMLQPIEEINQKELFQSNTGNLVKLNSKERRSQNNIKIKIDADYQ